MREVREAALELAATYARFTRAGERLELRQLSAQLEEAAREYAEARRAHQDAIRQIDEELGLGDAGG